MLIAVERKFLEEKAKLEKEFENSIEGIRKECWREAQDGLDADTRKIIADNDRLSEELRFQVRTTADLQNERDKLANAVKSMKRDLSLLHEKDKEFARQSFRQTREVKASKTKAANAEKRLMQTIRDFEADKQRTKTTNGKRIEELNIKLSGFKRLVDIKNKELKKMRSPLADYIESEI